MTINKRILFVDDDEFTFELIKRKLRKKNWNIFFANNGESALHLIENKNIAVLVTDLRMPVMNGIELLTKVTEKFPEIVKIVLSVMDDVNTIMSALRNGEIFRYIKKPVSYEKEFIPAIENGLEKYNKHQQELELIDNILNGKYKDNYKDAEYKKVSINIMKKMERNMSNYLRITEEYIESEEIYNRVLKDMKKKKLLNETKDLNDFSNKIKEVLNILEKS